MISASWHLFPTACLESVSSQKTTVRQFCKGNLPLQGRPPLLQQQPLWHPWWRQSLRQTQTSLLPVRYKICLQSCPAYTNVAWHAFCKHIALGRLLTSPSLCICR